MRFESKASRVGIDATKRGMHRETLAKLATEEHLDGDASFGSIFPGKIRLPPLFGQSPIGAFSAWAAGAT